VIRSLKSILAQNALEVAPALLGCKLIHYTPQGITAGLIVETEAYTQDDEASHSFRGLSSRTKVMFGPAGHAYVYFTYGMHYCFNVVAGREGEGQAVLIRALQPQIGLELMYARRFNGETSKPERELCNGPAKLVEAMGISKADYGTNLLAKGDLQLTTGITPTAIVQTTRIGIRHAIDAHRRFYIAGSTFVSKL
jgi:DNA-3-methyladenine glycosylase